MQGFCMADEQRYALTTARIDFVEHEILTFGCDVLCSQLTGTSHALQLAYIRSYCFLMILMYD